MNVSSNIFKITQTDWCNQGNVEIFKTNERNVTLLKSRLRKQLKLKEKGKGSSEPPRRAAIKAGRVIKVVKTAVSKIPQFHKSKKSKKHKLKKENK